MSQISEMIQALTSTGRFVRNVGDLSDGINGAKGFASRGSFLRGQAKTGGDLRRARAELEATLKPMEKMNDYQSSQFSLEQRREKVLTNMLKMQKAYEQSAKASSDKETSQAFKEKARAIDDLRNQYSALEKQERRYMELAKRVNELKHKGKLSNNEADELARANAEMDILAPQFKDISEQMQDINKSADELGDTMGGSVADGAEKSSKHMKDFGENTDESVKKTGKLAEMWQGLKDNLGKITIGALLGSAFAEFNELTNKNIEAYYNYGQAMSRVDHGVLRLSKDTWNLARMQTRLQYSANAMNLPLEAGAEIFTNLSQKVRNLYDSQGHLQFNVATRAAENIMAFSRVTGASIDQSTDLYARFINHFGRTNDQAIKGLNSIARAGQLVNEELQDAGIHGGIFISDLTGIINDAAGAFDGFTLNVEHLSSRVAMAVKTGHELGMTYDQAMDSAKQMASIFSKPGGFLGFQAGEQLRQDIASATKGIDDAEERASVLSSKYKISTSSARTLDVASKDVNAQMQVMDILKGTDAGMEKQFDLMKGVADNNAQSLEVFKQFVGGENLTAEQSGDLLQILRKGGNFSDFKSHVDRTKDETRADQVISNSVLGPKMIVDWIKASMGPVNRIRLAAAMTTLKAATAAGSVFAKIAKWAFIVAAVLAIPKMVRLGMAWAMDRFGDKIAWAKSWFVKFGNFTKFAFNKAEPYFKGALQTTKRIWGYVRSGSLFDHLGIFIKKAGGYLADIPRVLHSIWSLFRSGAARVTATIAKGGKGAAGLAARGYKRFSKGYKDSGAGVIDNLAGGFTGVLGGIGDFVGDALDPTGGEFGSGSAGQSEIAAARRRRREYMVKQGREEQNWAKEGKSVRWRKFGRTMHRAGSMLEPVAANLGKAKAYGGSLGKYAFAAGTALTIGTALMGADSAVSDDLNKDDEKKTAGQRKYKDKVDDNQKKSDDISETLEAVRGTHDQALIAALEAEQKAKMEERKFLDKDIDRLDKLEADYDNKKKQIKTLEDLKKKIGKKGRKHSKEATDALQKEIDALTKTKNADKDALNKEGMSPASDNAWYNQIGDWISRSANWVTDIYAGFEGMKMAGAMIAKVASWGARALASLTGKTGVLTQVIGWASEAKGLIGTLLDNPMIAKIVKVASGLGKFLTKALGVLDGVAVFCNTEGSLDEKIVAGVAGGGASFAIRATADAAATAIEGGGMAATVGTAGVGAPVGLGATIAAAGVTAAGQVAGHEAAAPTGAKVLEWYKQLKHSINGDTNVPTVMPSAASSSSAGAPTNGNMTMGPVGPDGKSQVTLTFCNAQQFVQSANGRIVSTQTGLSGLK